MNRVAGIRGLEKMISSLFFNPTSMLLYQSIETTTCTKSIQVLKENAFCQRASLRLQSSRIEKDLQKSKRFKTNNVHKLQQVGQIVKGI